MAHQRERGAILWSVSIRRGSSALPPRSWSPLIALATVGVLMLATVLPALAGFAIPITFATGGNPFAVAAADLDGDGKPDLAVVNFLDSTVSILRNTTASPGTPAFATREPVSTNPGPRFVTAADLDGNDKPDLAISDAMDNTVSVLLANPSGTLQLSSGTMTAGEGVGTAAVTLTRTGSTDGQVSAILSLTGGTATAGQDLIFSSPQTVTWADGDGADKTVSIPIIQDLIVEGNETVQFAMALPANRFGSVLGAQTTTSFTITDTNPAPALSIAGTSVPEGNSGSSPAAFSVTLTGSTAQAVTIQYATANGSASAGSDFTTTSGTLTFNPGETTRTISVPILGDTTSEPDEDFTVTLSTPTNATLGAAQAAGVIRNNDVAPAPTNNDTPPTVGIANASAPEGNTGVSTLTFPVTLVGPPHTQPITVRYGTANGTALDSADYAATHGTLTFCPGETTTSISVPIVGDTVPEPDETFTITLSIPTNAVIGQGQAIGTIQNDDAATACAPRPSVVSTLASDGGALQVHVEPTAYNTLRDNPLLQVKFGTFENAAFTMNGQVVANGQVVTLPINTFAIDFTAKRSTPGQPAIVPFSVVDGCGEWQTFVGGGTAAGF